MDRPTLRQLEYAVAVADEGHFGRAAELSHVSQPGLSSQVAELERRLGVLLFERTSRAVYPTAVGQVLIERFRAVLRDVDDLTAVATHHDGALRGILRIGAIPTMAPYLLPPIVATVRRLFPDVRLQFDEVRTTQLVEQLAAGSLDLGLLAIPVETGALTVEVLAKDPFFLALPVGHRLSGDKPIAFSALNDLEILLLEPGHCLRSHVADACAIDPLRSGPGRELHAASLATLAQMVASGEGVTLLPKSSLAVEARPGSGITTRPFRSPTPSRSIALAWRPTNPYGGLYREIANDLRRGFAEWLKHH
jgi:LysR family transcriptional regulator, hydrogen peroxide-inducible genes activator